MSLKSIVTNVANECGYTIESAIIGSNETTTKQLLTMAQRINREIFEAYPWPKCYASGAITTVAGQATYALPAAFSRYQYDTFWNQSTRWRILGPISEQEYAEMVGFGLTATIYTRFQIRGINNTELLLTPAPGSSGEILVFEYIADRSVRPATWAASTYYAPNAYTFYNGNYYQTAAGGTSGATPPTHTSGSASDGGVTWDYYNGPYQSFLADTDESFFSDALVEQGVKELFAQIHGLSTIVPKFQQDLHEEYSRVAVGRVVYAGGFVRDDIFARSGTAVFGTWI
jgi:hypothetical protein